MNLERRVHAVASALSTHSESDSEVETVSLAAVESFCAALDTVRALCPIPELAGADSRTTAQSVFAAAGGRFPDSLLPPSSLVNVFLAHLRKHEQPGVEMDLVIQRQGVQVEVWEAGVRLVQANRAFHRIQDMWSALIGSNPEAAIVERQAFLERRLHHTVEHRYFMSTGHDMIDTTLPHRENNGSSKENSDKGSATSTVIKPEVLRTKAVTNILSPSRRPTPDNAAFSSGTARRTGGHTVTGLAAGLAELRNAIVLNSNGSDSQEVKQCIFSESGHVFCLQKKIRDALYGHVFLAAVLVPADGSVIVDAGDAENKEKLSVFQISNHVAIKVLFKSLLQARVGKEGQRLQEDSLSETVTLQYLAANTGGRGHPHLIRLLGVLQTAEFVYVCEELCGTELFDVVASSPTNGRFSEATARGFFTQILSAVAFLHTRGIAHLDLSLENVLLARDTHVLIMPLGLGSFGGENILQNSERKCYTASNSNAVESRGNGSTVMNGINFNRNTKRNEKNGKNGKSKKIENSENQEKRPPMINTDLPVLLPAVKVIDFGLARRMPRSPRSGRIVPFEAREMYATNKSFYQDPAIVNIQSFDGRKADMFSLGAILWIMLMGSPAFEKAQKLDPNWKRIIKEIQNLPPGGSTGLREIIVERGVLLSAECVDLLCLLLEPRSECRPSAEEAMEHPWLRGFLDRCQLRPGPASPRALSESELRWRKNQDSFESNGNDGRKDNKVDEMDRSTTPALFEGMVHPWPIHSPSNASVSSPTTTQHDWSAEFYPCRTPPGAPLESDVEEMERSETPIENIKTRPPMHGRLPSKVLSQPVPRSGEAVTAHRLLRGARGTNGGRLKRRRRPRSASWDVPKEHAGKVAVGMGWPNWTATEGQNNSPIMMGVQESDSEESEEERPRKPGF